MVINSLMAKYMSLKASLIQLEDIKILSSLFREIIVQYRNRSINMTADAMSKKAHTIIFNVLLSYL